ncbi:MAG TPA: hypothetical protein VGN69_07310 [Solirubrobacteraceae bacterium]|nr:hypothetical protein [Solirubrobacteraceae bacterium]
MVTAPAAVEAGAAELEAPVEAPELDAPEVDGDADGEFDEVLFELELPQAARPMALTTAVTTSAALMVASW